VRDVLPEAAVEFGVSDRSNPPLNEVTGVEVMPVLVPIPLALGVPPAGSPSLCEPSLWTRSWCSGLSKAKEESDEEREV
jgi:hypothetical protein